MGKIIPENFCDLKVEMSNYLTLYPKLTNLPMRTL